MCNSPFLWINFAELAGKYRIGQRSQLALTSTNTLFCGTTICSCFVGMGGFLYWRRAFWICCLTSRRVLVVSITFYMDGVFPFAAFATALCG